MKLHDDRMNNVLNEYFTNKLLNEQGSRSARLSPQSMIHYARKLFIIGQVFHKDSTVFHNIGNDQMTILIILTK